MPAVASLGCTMKASCTAVAGWVGSVQATRAIPTIHTNHVFPSRDINASPESDGGHAPRWCDVR